MSSDTLASVSSPSVVNAVVGGSFAGPVPGPGRRWPASSLPRPSQPRPGLPLCKHLQGVAVEDPRVSEKGCGV